MDLDPSLILLRDVITELRTIRFVLLVIAGLMIFLVIPWIVISRQISKAGSFVANQTDVNENQAEIEALLASGQATAAKFAAIDWLARKPKQPQGLWLLGKAQYALGELVAAKGTFQNLLKIAPDWEYSITPWLDRIEGEIQAAGPKVVR